MGQYKKLCKRMTETAQEIQHMSEVILTRWKPTKVGDLKKKETLAGYVGFALGLYNAAESILSGELLSDGPVSVYEWLCMHVQMYRDDRELYVSMFDGSCEESSDSPDESSGSLDEFIKFLDKLVEDYDESESE